MQLWLLIGTLALSGTLAGGWWLTSRASSQAFPDGAVSRLSTQDIHALAFSPMEPDMVYFGHHGGLLASHEGGHTWQPAALQNTDAMALAWPPADPRIAYAAGHGVFFKSQDGGSTWQPLRTNLPDLDIHGFAADPNDANRVYAHVVGHGLFASQDGGATCFLRLGNLDNTTYNLAVGEASGRLYAAVTASGLWHSSDDGLTWSVASGLPGAGAIAVAYDPAGRRLYASTLGDEGGLYVSDDNADSWRPLRTPGAFMAIAVSPLDANRLIVVDRDGWVYSSRDASTTWPAE